MVRQQFEYHPRIGYRFIPNLKTRVLHEGGGYLVYVNSQGFRCRHEFLAAKPPGGKRVLLFGDSFTAGDGVRNEARFGDWLERLVPGLEVYNFGLPGSGTDQQYLCFQEYAQGIEKDLVVIALQVENIRRVGSKYRPYFDDRGKMAFFAKPYFERNGDGSLLLKNVPVPRDPVDLAAVPEADRGSLNQGGRYPALRGLVNTLGLRDVAQKLSSYQPCPEYQDASHPAWLLLRSILEEWMAHAGAPVLVFLIPLYHYVEELADPEPYQMRFRELARSRGWLVHDPLPDLRAYTADSRRRFRFPKDVHPTADGHEALARSLAPAVERVLAVARS